MNFKNYFNVGIPALGALVLCAGCSSSGGNASSQEASLFGSKASLSERSMSATSAENKPQVAGSGIATLAQSVVCSPTGARTGSVSCSFAAAPAQGDLVLVGAAVSQNPANGAPRTVTTPTGFSAIPTATGGMYDQMASFYKAAGANEPKAYTFTTKSGDYFGAIAYDIQNSSPTLPIFDSPAIYGNSPGNITTNSNTSSAPAGSLGITFLSSDSANVSNVPAVWSPGVYALAPYHEIYSWTQNNFPAAATGWSGTTKAVAGGRMIVVAPAPTATLPPSANGMTMVDQTSSGPVSLPYGGTLAGLSDSFGFNFNPNDVLTPVYYVHASVSPAPVSGNMSSGFACSGAYVCFQFAQAPNTTYTVTVTNAKHSNGGPERGGAFTFKSANTSLAPQAPVGARNTFQIGTLQDSCPRTNSQTFCAKIPQTGQIDPTLLSDLVTSKINNVRYGPSPTEIDSNCTPAGFHYGNNDPLLASLANKNIKVLWVMDVANPPSCGAPSNPPSHPWYATTALYGQYCGQVAVKWTPLSRQIRRQFKVDVLSADYQLVA